MKIGEISLKDSRALKRVVILIAIATLLFALVTLPILDVDEQPSFPMRLAFYYPWFPAHWLENGIYPFTNYHPTLGYYDSSDGAVIARHVAAMQYGNIEGAIVSWWGQGSNEDARFDKILTRTAGSTFRWAVYYEPEGATVIPVLLKLHLI